MTDLCATCGQPSTDLDRAAGYDTCAACLRAAGMATRDEIQQASRPAPTITVKSSALRPGHIVREHGMRVRIDSVHPYASDGPNRDRYPVVYSCPGTVLNVPEVRAARIVPAGFLACEVHPGGACWHVQGNDLARWRVERHAADCAECRQVIETCTCGSQLCPGWRHMARESHWCVAAHAGRLGALAAPAAGPEHSLAS